MESDTICQQLIIIIDSVRMQMMAQEHASKHSTSRNGVAGLEQEIMVD